MNEPREPRPDESRPSELQLILMRHGQTPGNLAKKYVGRTDEPLSDVGRETAAAAGLCPSVTKVYVSPLQRARQTAAICFPQADQQVVDDLREMDFGIFEGRSYLDMKDDPAYQAWVDTNCESPCPEGEDKEGFTARTMTAFRAVISDAFEQGEGLVIIVAHGGTVMAVLDSLTDDERAYYQWHVDNCQGYRGRLIWDGLQLRIEEPELFETLDFLEC